MNTDWRAPVALGIVLLGLLLFGLGFLLGDDEAATDPGTSGAKAGDARGTLEVETSAEALENKPSGGVRLSTTPAAGARGEPAEVDPDTSEGEGEGEGEVAAEIEPSLRVEVTCDGRPAPGATVRYRERYVSRHSKRLEGVAPVTFEKLNPGQATVDASFPGCASRRIDFLVLPGSKHEMTFELTQGWRIEGRVVSKTAECKLEPGAGGGPPEGARLHIMQKLDRGLSVAFPSPPLRPDGTFEVLLEPGSYSIKAKTTDQMDMVVVQADGAQKVCLVLDLTNAEMMKLMDRGLRECLPPPASPEDVETRIPCGAESVETSCSISGRVRDGDGPAPLVQVSLFPSTENRCDGGWPKGSMAWNREVTTDEDGEYVVEGLPCVSTSLLVHRFKDRGFLCRRGQVHFPPGTNTVRQDLVLESFR